MFAGAKGGSSSFKQTPDNLRSNDTFEGVLGLGIGPFKGPTRGLKSIKIDGTAIENATGEQNFQDFIATLGDGDPLKFPQRVQLKLGAGAAPTQVGLSLPNVGGTDSIWISRTLNNTNADFVDLRFIVQQLFRQDSKGIYTTSATLEIQMKPVGSKTWINPTLGTPSGSYKEEGVEYTDGEGGLMRMFLPRTYYSASGQQYASQSSNYVITGKTSSPAVYELRIGLPNTGSYANTGWDIRVRLLERESYTGGKDNTDQEKRTIAWESMSAVYSTVLGEHEDWRGVAWLQLYGKASDQLTGVPEITGEYDTKIVKVPANVYDPNTRQYTNTIWDGSWAKAYTNDPAWVINDAISDELSGLSLIARGSYLNKWDALDLSKYCSQLVPDGAGGQQPRYCLNLAISQPQKAEEFIRYLAGAVGALAWDQGDGEWRVKVDKPEAPVDLFTLDNIEDQFIYSHTDVDTRFNDIIGQFKNAEMDYRADAVQLYDNPSIALLGRKPTTIALVGCTDRQEAMRRVKLRLRATVNENRIVTFTTNRRGRNIEQLSTILIADGDLGDQERRTTGRTIAVAADRRSIVVRDPVYLAPGVAYTMRFTVPNPVYAPQTATQPADENWTKPTVVLTRGVSNNSTQRGSVTTIYLDTALPSSIADNLSVALEATNLPTLPRLFRVTSVMPQDDGERVSISAINIDTGKWDAADNVSKQDTIFQDLRGAVPIPRLPPAGRVLSLVKVPVEQGNSVNLVATWQRPPGAFISGFNIKYSVNGGALQTAVERTQESTFEWINPVAGNWHVEVTTLDRRGGVSLPLIDDFVVDQEVLGAGDIKYDDGQDVESLKPAEPGATNTANPNSLIGKRTVAEVLAELAEVNARLKLAQDDLNEAQNKFDDLAEKIQENYDIQEAEANKLANVQIRDILDRESLRRYVDARLFIEGEPVGVVVVKNETRSIEADEVFAQNFDLFGIRGTDGYSWLLDMDTVRVSPTVSLAERFSSIDSVLNNNSSSIQSVGRAVTTLSDSTTYRFSLATSRFEANEASIRNLSTTVVNLTSSTSTQFQLISSRFNSNESTVTDLTKTIVTLTESTASRFEQLRSRFESNEAVVGSLSQTVTNLTSSTASRFDEVSVRFGNNESSIRNLTQATSDLTSSVSTQFSRVYSRFEGNEASIDRLNTTVVNLTSSTSQTFQSINSRFGENESKIANLQTTYADFNSSTARSFESINTRFGNAEGSINELRTSVSNVSSSLSTLNDTVNARFGTNETRITNMYEAFAGPSGSYGKALQLIDVNGNISGTYNTNNGRVSTYSILTNVFQIVDPNNGNAYTPFRIENNVVKMSNVEVDRLKINTAVVPGFVSSNVNVQGTN